jgi:uncharacterized Ntn-hydrolase superfamily protein
MKAGIVRQSVLIGLLVTLVLVSALGAVTEKGSEPVATFSIVGFDPETGDLGIAVASKFLAVGSVVPWAKAGIGAIATQAYANTTYGPKGLELLASGLTAQQTLNNLLAADEGRETRQVGIVDAKGEAVTCTGKGCNAWAGGKTGKHYACQGNILVSEATVTALATAFESSEGDLAVRLVKALKAGEQAGGDSRGKQSAALLVVREGGGFLGLNDRYIDLRVDDHPEPIDELSRLLSLQMAYSALYRAGALRQEGKLDAAIAELKKASEASPNSPEVAYDLACYYSLAGMKAQALDTLRKALTLAPSFKKMARDDADLAPLRDEETFKKMLGE